MVPDQVRAVHIDPIYLNDFVANPYITKTCDRPYEVKHRENTDMGRRNPDFILILKVAHMN